MILNVLLRNIIFQFIRIDYVEIVTSYYDNTNIDAEALSYLVTLIVLLYPFERLEQENLQTQIYINIDTNVLLECINIFYIGIYKDKNVNDIIQSMI